MIIFLSVLSAQCASTGLFQPPGFSHHHLRKKFFRDHPGGHYPITVQKGLNHQPTVTHDGYMLYVSDQDGSRNIRLRQLATVMDLSLLRHDSVQHSPSISKAGKRIAFVSEDRDYRGDIRVLKLKYGLKNVIASALRGSASINLWSLTKNISSDFEKLSETLPIQCRGQALETSPLWSPDGKTLLFVSDRCSGNGTRNIWLARMEGIKPIGKLHQLTSSGGIHPSIDARGISIAYLAPQKNSARFAIRLMDIRTGRSRKIHLPRKDKLGRTFIYLNPQLSGDGSRLFFLSIRRDTNHNGIIDKSDHPALFVKQIKESSTSPASERQLSEPTSIIDFDHTQYLGGSIIYSANIRKSVNIFWMGQRGIIPVQSNIQKQYALAGKYKYKAPHRYVLALQSTLDLFRSSPNYIAFRLPVLADVRRFLSNKGTEKIDLEIIKERLRILLKTDPYARLQLAVRGRLQKGFPIAYKYSNFLRHIPSMKSSYKDTELRFVHAHALDQLALAHKTEGRPTKALGILSRLSRDFPSYPDRHKILLRIGRLQLLLTHKIPSVFYKSLKKKNSHRIYFQREIPESIYEHFAIRLPPGRSLRYINKEISKAQIRKSRLIYASLLAARSASLNALEKPSEALLDATAATKILPIITTTHLRALHTIAFSLERLGRNPEALAVRMRLGGAYNGQSGMKLHLDEYLDIINQSERLINENLEAGRSIVRSIDDSIQSNRSLIGLRKAHIPLTAVQYENLQKFCKIGSHTWTLMQNLGRPTIEHAILCKHIPRAAEPRILKSDIARDTARLYYYASHAAATRLNILFLFMKRTNQFPDIYNERAIRYHRRKIDIALELNQHQIKWSNKTFSLIKKSDLKKQFGAGDPFNDAAFTALESGYKLASENARLFGDLSVLYGYAYALIRKSIQRQNYYDELMKGTIELSPNRLRKYKSEILRDLKIAEYNLRYMIFAEPLNPDPYLLLGWMYQYMDERKTVAVKISPSITEKLFLFLIRTTPTPPTDGILYQDLYRSLFPDRLFEANIALYSQAISLQTGDSHPEKILHLHLNLANTYFNLLNFRKAVESYEKVNALILASDKNPFVDYRQEALFHFNHGRSLFYESNSISAAKELKKAYDIYDANERKKLHEKFSALTFALISAPISGNLKLIQGSSKRRDLLTQKIIEVNYKMALIGALLGLSHMESHNYREAIARFKEAEHKLYANTLTHPSAIPRANLLNFQAMAEQKLLRFAQSDISARAAARYANAQRSTFSDPIPKYQAQFLASRLLGIFLKYGEDFSVIGAGKNPYGFSALRQYELALGILLKNKLLGNVKGAYKLLHTRRTIFRNFDLHTKAGMSAYIISYNTEAYTYYLRGNYIRSGGLFLRAAAEALKQDYFVLFRENILNYTHVLFAFIENDPSNPEFSLRLINDSLGYLNRYYTEYEKKISYEYKKERKNKSSLSKEDKIQIRIKTNRELHQIIAARGLLYYYRASILDSKASKASDLHAAFSEYSNSIRSFNEALQFGKGDIRGRLRIRMNLAMAMAGRGNLLGARARLRTLRTQAYEFGLIAEEFEFLRALAFVNRKLYSFNGDRRHIEKAYKQLNLAIRMIRLHKEYFTSPGHKLYGFYDFAVSFFIEYGYQDRALKTLDQKWEHRLMRDYFAYALNFEKPEYNLQQFQMQTSRQKLLAAYEREFKAGIERGDADSFQIRRKKLQNRLKLLRQTVLRSRPRLRPFLEFSRDALRSSPPQGSAIFRFYTHGNFLYTWFITSSRKKFFSTKISKSLHAALKSSVRKAIEGRNYERIFILPDEKTYARPLNKIFSAISNALPTATFITRLSDPIIGVRKGISITTGKLANYNILNAKSAASVNDPSGIHDIVRLKAPASEKLFPPEMKGAFNARKWISSRKLASTALIDNGGKFSYSRDASIYEILHASGTSTILFGQDNHLAHAFDKLQNKNPIVLLREKEVRFFGLNPAHRSIFLRQSSSFQLASSRKAKSFEQKADLKEAASFLRLAATVQSGTKPSAKIAYNSKLRLLLLLRSRDPLCQKHPSNKICPEGKANEIYESLLKDAGKSFRKVFAIHHIELKALFRLKKSAKAELYLKRIASSNITLARALRKKTAILSFLADLRHRKKRGKLRANFQKRYNILFRQIKSKRIAARIVRELRKRTLFLQARTLSRNITSRDVNRNLLLREIRLDRILLGLDTTRPDAPQRTDPFYIRLISHSLRNEWKSYDSNLKILPESQSYAVRKFRLRMYGAWRQQSNSGYFNIADLANVSVGIGRTAYSQITAIERVLLFRMLVLASKFDPDMQSASYAQSLIRLSRIKEGPERAALFALLLSSTYIDRSDFVTASIFFRAHQKHARKSATEAIRFRMQARIGKPLERLNLIRFRKKENRRDIVLQWNQILRKDRYAFLPRIYSSMPKNQTPQEIRKFNRFLRRFIKSLPTYPGDAVKQFVIALQSEKYRASKKGDWNHAVNLALLASKIEALSKSISLRNQRFSDLRYRDVATILSAKLPAGQTAVFLLDEGDSAHRIIFKKGANTRADSLNISGRFLAGKLGLYLRKIAVGRPDFKLHIYLSSFYRSLFPRIGSGIKYFWFESIHALAPIVPERGDQIYQIADASLFVRRPAHRISLSFGRGMKIISGRTTNRYRARREARGKSRMNRIWRQRQNLMERTAVGELSRGKSDAVHYFRKPDLLPPTSPRFKARKLRKSSWFISASIIRSGKEPDPVEMNRLLSSMAAAFSRPGVITLRKPERVAHPVFLKYYYDRTLPPGPVESRYSEAYIRMRRQSAKNDIAYGYRLVTPVMLLP